MLATTGDEPSWTAWLLDWSTRIHFGRWPNPLLKALWCFMGLVPTVLAVTGLVMWWNRSLRHQAKGHAAARRIRVSHSMALAAASIDGAVESLMAAEDIARICHAHPSMSEVMREAALAVDKRSLNG